MDLGDSILSSIVQYTKSEVENFIKQEPDKVEASNQLNHLIIALGDSHEAMDTYSKATFKTGSIDPVEVEKVMEAIRDIQNIGTPSKGAIERANVVNTALFWNRLKRFKEELNSLEKKALKKGQRVEKVEKAKEFEEGDNFNDNP